MQELHSNQEAAITDFDDEGFSAAVKFTSPNAGGGSMTTYLVRGMVSRWPGAGRGDRARWWRFDSHYCVK